MNLDIRAGIITRLKSRLIDGPDERYGNPYYTGLSGQGFLLAVGLKWRLKKNWLRSGAPNHNPLIGTYLKPELTYSQYRWVDTYPIGSPGTGSYGSLLRHFIQTFNIVALNLIVGRQMTIGQMPIDLYVGTGLGNNLNRYKGERVRIFEFEHDEHQHHAYAQFFINSWTPITLLGGLRIGFNLTRNRF